MFIINPDPYSSPCYRIGPFTTRDISLNRSLKESSLFDKYLDERFCHQNYIYTQNGREAINVALKSFNLNRTDIVTILTTSGNFYISGCVTNEIEKFCGWSRKIIPETKLLFVNHEFGYPYQNLSGLKKYNLPIIEDCAGSFFSIDQENEIGKVGDFVIYSFPKMFPLQVGGLLVSNHPGNLPKHDLVDEQMLRYIKNVLSHYILVKDQIIEDRISNYKKIRDLLSPDGFRERFDLGPGIVPGVFLFRTDKAEIDLPEMKKYLWAHGIHCSVFYGEKSFFIPVHQALGDDDLQYFYEVINAFLKESQL